MTRFVSILLFILAFLSPSAQGQLEEIKKLVQEMNADGSAEPGSASSLLIDSLMKKGTQQTEAGPKAVIDQQDAIDIAALIQQARKDPETGGLAQRMKIEQKELLAGIKKDMSEPQIVAELKKGLDELKMLEYLFKDKERALREMEKEGMVDRRRLSDYKKNPDLLEADTRKGLYFTFVSLAVAGGFM